MRTPVIILNLTPEPAIDYAAFNAMGDRTRMTGEWLAHCSACPVPEIANVFHARRGSPSSRSPAMLHNDPECWNEVDAYIDAARVADIMFHNRLGLMGHYYNGMLDIASDTTLQCATFGGHIEIIEVEQLAALRRDVAEAEIADRVHHFHDQFDVQLDCPLDELQRSARTSVALDRLVEVHRSGIHGVLPHGHRQRGE